LFEKKIIEHGILMVIYVKIVEGVEKE